MGDWDLLLTSDLTLSITIVGHSVPTWTALTWKRSRSDRVVRCSSWIGSWERLRWSEDWAKGFKSGVRPYFAHGSIAPLIRGKRRRMPLYSFIFDCHSIGFRTICSLVYSWISINGARLFPHPAKRTGKNNLQHILKTVIMCNVDSVKY